MTTFVYDFAEGDREQKDLLGGKGANLAEMTNLGLPVPPGSTITTEACRAYLVEGAEPPGLADEVTGHLVTLEETMGKRLGQADDPPLVLVRSGAKFSMPGMMETVLDVGLNDDSVHGLAAQAGDERFAWDSYRRLIQMFGATVLGIERTCASRWTWRSGAVRVARHRGRRRARRDRVVAGPRGAPRPRARCLRRARR